jgi:TolB-like protein/DNA-binding winged helix-turn-helix (wHTH) protein
MATQKSLKSQLMDIKASQDMEFGSYRVSVRERRLLQNGQEVPITPKAFDTLLVLICRAGQLVEKQELMTLVWGDVFVDDSTLTQNIFTIRKALGDGDYIETVPRRGYRFVASVAPAGTADVVPRRWIRHHLVWSAVGVVAAMVVVVGWMSWAGEPAPDSIVVLPFRDLTPGNQMQYLADGLTEEVIATLDSDEALRVIARSTAFYYGSQNLDIRYLGRQLEVGAVLDGSIRTEKDRIRVTVQLNNAATGYPYWSDRFDRPAPEVYALAHDIALAINQTLGGNLRSKDPKPVNADAYLLYLQGVAERQRTFGTSEAAESVRLLEAAVDKDPSFAKAHAELAFGYLSWAPVIGLETGYTKARAALRRATAIDADISMAHTVDGRIKLTWDWDVSGAIDQLQRASKLDRTNAVAYHWLSHAYETAGRMEEAREAIREAQRIEPHSAAWVAQEARHYIMTGQMTQGIETAHRALRLQPGNPIAPRYLRAALSEAGRFDDAIDVMVQAGVATREQAAQARTRIAARGAQSFWQWNLKLSEQNTRDPQRPYSIAQSYAHLGDIDAALLYLEEAFQQRAPRMWEINIEPAFKSLRSNPRFQSIVDRMNLK